MRNDMKFTKLALTLAVAGALTACGGGGGGGGGGSEPVAPPSGGDSTPPVTKICEDLPTANFVQSEVDVTNDLFSISDSRGEPWYTGIVTDEKDYLFQVIQDEDKARSGQLVERYELRTGDCFGSDCGRRPPYYRSESSVDGPYFQRGWNKWVAYNFKLGEQFDVPEVGQIDREAWISQLLVFHFADDGRFIQAAGNLFVGVEYGTGDLVLVDKDWDLDLSQCNSDGVCREEFNGKTTHVIAEAGTFEDDWHSIVMDVTFDTDGEIKLWFDGVCKVNESANTMGEGWNSVGNKWGLYRAQSADEFNDPSLNYIQSIYFDDIREGDAYDDIAF